MFNKLNDENLLDSTYHRWLVNHWITSPLVTTMESVTHFQISIGKKLQSTTKERQDMKKKVCKKQMDSFVCNSIAYGRMENRACPINDSCNVGQFELKGRCFDNDRKLDYIRCYHKHDCDEDSNAICDVIGCDNVICDFDTTEVAQMMHQCLHCDQRSESKASVDVVGVRSGAFDRNHLQLGSVSEEDVESSSPRGGGAEDEPQPIHGQGRTESLSEKWKTLASHKQRLVSDFVLPGSHSLQHQDGTEAAFEAVASDFTKRQFKKRALVDLPLLTSYEDVCCSRDQNVFPDVITPEFVMTEFVKQSNFSHITCANAECGPHPST